ncbi:MAG TPA: hypothetical protein VMS76_13000 [Planctomycetota bacterium]|nr:hypothetical protein [Planctomycetota bacterium]
MLIECPFCHAQAQLPGSREGSKVRCGGCGKVYVAREPDANGRRADSGGSGVTIGITIGAVVLLALIALVINKLTGADTVTAVKLPPPPPREPQVDHTGWESRPVVAVRELYDAAASRDTGKLASLISGAGLVELRRAAAANPPEGAQPAPDRPVPPIAWGEMTTEEREELLAQVLDELTGEEGEDAVALWKPFDGSVVEEQDQRATVRVQVQRRDGSSLETRRMEWRLVKEGDRWKAAAWERWLSPEELRAARTSRSKEVSKVQLEGGAVLFQADPRPLPHLEDTPLELRAKIDPLCARLVDFTLRPRENDAAQRELVAIGRPAIPILLTQLYEIRMVDDESASKVNKVYQTLVDITGYDPGFTLLGSTDERRQATLKAYFAWWLRKGEERFEEKVEQPDLLDTLIQPTEKDLREIERSKKKPAPPGG